MLNESPRSAFLRPRARVIAGGRKRSADALATSRTVIPTSSVRDNVHHPIDPTSRAGESSHHGNICPSTPITRMRNLKITSPSTAQWSWKTPSPVARQVPLKVLSNSATPVKNSAKHLTVQGEVQQHTQLQSNHELPPRTPVTTLQNFSSIRSTPGRRGVTEDDDAKMVPISSDEVDEVRASTITTKEDLNFFDYRPNSMEVVEDSPCSTISSTSASWCSLMRMEMNMSLPPTSPPSTTRRHLNANGGTAVLNFPRIAARTLNPTLSGNSSSSAQPSPARRAKLTPKKSNGLLNCVELSKRTPQMSNCSYEYATVSSSSFSNHHPTHLRSNSPPPRDGNIVNGQQLLLSDDDHYNNLSLPNLQNSVVSSVASLIPDNNPTNGGVADCEFNSDGFPSVNNALVQRSTTMTIGEKSDENEDFFLSMPSQIQMSTAFHRQHDDANRSKEAKQAKKSHYPVLGETGEYLTNLNDVNMNISATQRASGNVATFGRSASATSSLTCFSSNSLSEFFTSNLQQQQQSCDNVVATGGANMNSRTNL